LKLQAHWISVPKLVECSIWERRWLDNIALSCRNRKLASSLNANSQHIRGVIPERNKWLREKKTQVGWRHAHTDWVHVHFFYFPKKNRKLRRREMIINKKTINLANISFFCIPSLTALRKT
jgi:hypothetical protein